MTKSYTRTFLQDVTEKPATERDTLRRHLHQGRSDIPLEIDRNGRAIIDIALNGAEPTNLASIAVPGAPVPDVKLRRYIQEGQSTPGTARKLTAATAGVDVSKRAFEALVAHTEKKDGVKDQDAIQKTISDLLDAAERKQTMGASNKQIQMRLDTPEGTVCGQSRGERGTRIDDYRGLLLHDERDPREIGRAKTSQPVAETPPAQGRTSADEKPDREAVVKALAHRRRQEEDARKPGRRTPSKGDEEIGG